MASNPKATSRKPLRFPKEGNPEELKAFRDSWFNYDSAYRNAEMERMARNLYYSILDRQWVETDTEIIPDGVRGFVLKDVDDKLPVQLPKPVTNYIAPAVEIELSHLTSRELTANVVPTSSDPRIIQAAKKAKNILDHRLRILNWPDIREQAALIMIVTGTVAIRSLWDEKYTDLTRVATPGSVACPNCGLKMSSRKQPQRNLQALPVVNNAQSIKANIPEDPDEGESVSFNHCPQCESPVPLIPYEPSVEEVEGGADIFGNPMGVDVPKGNTNIEIVSPFDLFPENSGIGVDPTNCRIWGQATPRSMDWVEERYPERVDEIEPEEPQELMRTHPILGEWSYIGRYHSSLDSNVYDNHVRVYELHAEPSYRFPQGRSVVIAGDVVLEDGPLNRVVDVEGGKLIVPRVRYSASRFKVVPGNFWGRGLPDILISPQNRINGMDAQTIEARERMGSPNILVSDDMDLTGPEWFEGYGGGKIMKFTRSPLAPQERPEPFGSILMPVGVFQERAGCIQDMKELAGPQDIEQGEAPRNISTTSGLQILGEQAERRRRPRERPMVKMFETIWEHQLKLIWVLRAEPDEYVVETEDGREEDEVFDRTALEGQTKVKVEKQAYVDRSIYQKEAAREAQIDGLYRIESQASVKRLLELRGLPTDVNEDLNQQVEHAREQWSRFYDDGEIPVIDTMIDNYQIHFEVLSTLLRGDNGKKMERQRGWLEVYKLLIGWEQEYDAAEARDQQVLAFYGSRNLPPEQANDMYAKGLEVYTDQRKAFELTQQTQMAPPPPEGMAPGVMPPPMVAPPQPPPPPVFLPAATNEKVMLVWNQMLNFEAQRRQSAAQQQMMQLPPEQQMMIQAQGGMPIEPMPPVDQEYMKFRAVVYAYNIMAVKAQMAMGGLAPAAPPAGPAPGTQPNVQARPSNPQPPAPPVPPQL